MMKYLFIISMLYSCAKPICIEGFDQKVWLDDIGGCKGNRKEIVTILKQNKEAILGKEQTQIIELLGKPDRLEIYKRSQMFFIYSLEPSSDCENYKESRSTRHLTLRYNALGKVTSFYSN